MIRYFLLEPSDTHLLNLVQVFLKDLNEIYPNFNKWYTDEVLPNIQKTRKVVVACDGHVLCGVMILKIKPQTKLCTLYVSENYRNQGLGSNLMKLCFSTLRTFNPHVTVSSKVIDHYVPLFKKNNFKLYKTYDNYYLEGTTEYSFNGYQ